MQKTKTHVQILVTVLLWIIVINLRFLKVIHLEWSLILSPIAVATLFFTGLILIDIVNRFKKAI